MLKKVILLFILLFLIINANAQKQDDFPLLKGPYLGQKSPGSEPRLFMPGVITTHGLDICIAFLEKAKVCVFSNNTNEIFFTYEKNGTWTKPGKIPFVDEQGKVQYTAGPDGKTLYFTSSRPTHPRDHKKDLNSWMVKWTGSGWSKPVPLPAPANTGEYHEIYPSKTTNGSLYFFSGWRKEAPLGDIYRCKFIDGKYQKAEKPGYPVNTEYHELDPFVAPDESFLIFGSNRPGGFDFFDQYISFRKEDGTWTPPLNLGEKINSYNPGSVRVTLDGKYFFFASSHPTDIPKGKKVSSLLIDRVGDKDLYWVETGFIKELRQIALGKEHAAPIIHREYQENGLQAAIKKLKDLYSPGKGNYYFSISGLLITCGHMIKEGKGKDAEKFYETLLQVLPGKSRIKQGYAAVNILNGFTAKGTNLLRELWSEYPAAKSERVLEPLYSHLNFTGKKNDELTLLRFITVEFPNSYIAFYDLASIFARMGDIELAINNCKKSLALKPDFADAKKLLTKLRLKQEEEDFPVLTGPYLGQKPPGIKPEIFAPGIVSKDGYGEGCSGFMNEGKIFIFENMRNSDDWRYGPTWIMELKDGVWTKPHLAPFNDLAPYNFTVSPDSKTLYFTSIRDPGDHNKLLKQSNLWIVHITDSGWTEPKIPGPTINTDKYYENYPSVTHDGTVYYMLNHPSGYGKVDVCRSRPDREKYHPVENIGKPVNSEYSEADPFIAPDESYVIFCSQKPGGYGKFDMYISFRNEDDKWTKPINMGPRINSTAYEFRPCVTPDGKYLFFTRGDEGWDHIYWVDARIIEKLKPKE